MNTVDTTMTLAQRKAFYQESMDKITVKEKIATLAFSQKHISKSKLKKIKAEVYNELREFKSKVVVPRLEDDMSPSNEASALALYHLLNDRTFSHTNSKFSDKLKIVYPVEMVNE